MVQFPNSMFLADLPLERRSSHKEQMNCVVSKTIQRAKKEDPCSRLLTDAQPHFFIDAYFMTNKKPYVNRSVFPSNKVFGLKTLRSADICLKEDPKINTDIVFKGIDESGLVSFLLDF